MFYESAKLLYRKSIYYVNSLIHASLFSDLKQLKSGVTAQYVVFSLLREWLEYIPKHVMLLYTVLSQCVTNECKIT